ncbi:MAG: hypothetical protein GPI99_24965 [Microcystis aeruginosa W13-15]|nr:hypothetical protein [Microcystis aeruginosa W13-15]
MVNALVFNGKAVVERRGFRPKIFDEKIEGLTVRVGYQEFTNRGILIALVVAVLGGAAKLFGFFPNP